MWTDGGLFPQETYMRRATSASGRAAGRGVRSRRSKTAEIASKAKKRNEDDSPYRDTVNLPSTSFPLRANAVQREPQIQSWWRERNIYFSCVYRNPGPTFTLHDGPPYANGALHIGHALNKMLKDFVNRYMLLRGRKALFVPGWDTHGLPIELKVLSSLSQPEREALSACGLRQKAREFALAAVDEQRAGFERYGIWADWDSPYLTLSPEYEAAQLEVFAQMALSGHIYRGLKPVHWSPSTGTALAEAELEYPDGHVSPSIFVGMDAICNGDPNASDPLGIGINCTSPPCFAIWTTTPWTIPANQAIAVNPELMYILATPSKPLGSEGTGSSSTASHEHANSDASTNSSESSKQHSSDSLGSFDTDIIVAKDLKESLERRIGKHLEVVNEAKGKELAGVYAYVHPLFTNQAQKPIVAGGSYITTESGTGLVHTAPGHGHDDFRTGLESGLPVVSPVDGNGVYTEDVGHPELAGLDVLSDGNNKVVELLRNSGHLIAQESYEHKYPYDWRSKQPTILRTTEQWFASIDGFRQQALDAIGTVQWFPSSGEKRVRSMVESREDWCISRQRTWGLPIPAFYDQQTGDVLMDQATLCSIIEKVRQHGADIWWEWSAYDLLPEEYKHRAKQLEKGMDTMDVWFDSGTSWNAVVNSRYGLDYPADMYLEGSDQHRGWFQSSLLTSVAVNARAPFKEVVTHGFVMDESGNKMSKSLGNVVDPAKVIEGGEDQKKEPGRGADVLRMWVGSVDYSTDACLGETIIQQQAENYRKIRGTLRFLLGNLAGFDPAQHEVPFEELPSLDRYALHVQKDVHDFIEQAYDAYEFYKVSRQLNQHVITFLSNFYLDLAKDRLYIRSEASYNRRSCQTVLYHCLRLLTAALAPIAPHTSEDVWQHLPQSSDARHAESIFLEGWPAYEAANAVTIEEISLWQMLLQLREEVNILVEEARNAKTVRAPLEAQLQVHCTGDYFNELASSLLHAESDGGNGADELRTVLLVSQAKICETSEAAAAGCEHTRVVEDHPLLGTVTIGVSPAAGHKCERCWNFSRHVGEWDEHPTLCERCAPVVLDNGFFLKEEHKQSRKNPAAVA